jgi:hypothetical protein
VSLYPYRPSPRTWANTVHFEFTAPLWLCIVLFDSVVFRTGFLRIVLYPTAGVDKTESPPSSDLGTIIPDSSRTFLSIDLEALRHVVLPGNRIGTTQSSFCKLPFSIVELNMTPSRI